MVFDVLSVGNAEALCSTMPAHEGLIDLDSCPDFAIAAVVVNGASEVGLDLEAAVGRTREIDAAGSTAVVVVLDVESCFAYALASR